MGLDMYAYRAASGAELGRYDNDAAPDMPEEDGALERFFYWRKHANLHGWMEKLYREKGGKEEVFNCVPFRLRAEDLDRLEADMLGDKLPHTTGFFFGNSVPEDDDATHQFIAQAREAIAAGDAVFYDSWW